jgi:hypothetical protein
VWGPLIGEVGSGVGAERSGLRLLRLWARRQRHAIFNSSAKVRPSVWVGPTRPAGSAMGGGAATSARYHAALEGSVAASFPGNHVINCMCHSTENLYRWAWVCACVCARACGPNALRDCACGMCSGGRQGHSRMSQDVCACAWRGFVRRACVFGGRVPHLTSNTSMCHITFPRSPFSPHTSMAATALGTATPDPTTPEWTFLHSFEGRVLHPAQPRPPAVWPPRRSRAPRTTSTRGTPPPRTHTWRRAPTTRSSSARCCSPTGTCSTRGTPPPSCTPWRGARAREGWGGKGGDRGGGMWL